MNATTAPSLPGLLSARRLLEMGCAETVVRQVLVIEVGLSTDEASTAIDAARTCTSPRRHLARRRRSRSLGPNRGHGG